MSNVPMLVEELEARFELASFMGDNADLEAAGDGCCSGSCCIIGGDCTPTPTPTPKPGA